MEEERRNWPCVGAWSHKLCDDSKGAMENQETIQPPSLCQEILTKKRLFETTIDDTTLSRKPLAFRKTQQ